MKFLLITFVFWAIAQLYDVSQRDKDSSSSPEELSLAFYLQDNLQKLITGLLLSLLLSVGMFLIREDIGKIYIQYQVWFSVAAGLVPELLLSWLKRRTNFLREEKVQGFQRKKKE